MKRNLSKTLLKFTLIIPLMLLLNNCSDTEETTVNSEIELKNFILSNNFFQKSPLNESHTYSFIENKFVLTLKDKRSNNQRTFNGNYEIKSSKFSDNGKSFFYVKLIFIDKNYSDISYLVYYEGKLVEPSNQGKFDKTEDEYGLNIPQSHVSLAPDYLIYSVIQK
jgi:hypothetical protein